MALINVFKLSLLLALVGLLSSGAIAQSSSGGISSCASMVMTLSPCLSNNTRASSRPPSSACCSALSNVVQVDPQCLCSVLNNGAGSTIGMILPLTFPRACNIQTTNLSQCSAPAPSTVPSAMAPSSTTPTGTPIADSPTGSPNEVEPEAPSSDTPTDSGSKNLPPFTAGSFSNGGITKHSCNLLVFALFVISWTSAAAPF